MIVSIGFDTFAKDDVVIVANYQQGELDLTKSEVSRLFMGGVLEIKLKPIALTPRHITRVLFNTKVIGLTESRIQSYWAQMRFSGRKNPPKEFKSEEELLDYMLRTPGTITYLPSDTKVPAPLVTVYSTQPSLERD